MLLSRIKHGLADPAFHWSTLMSPYVYEHVMLMRACIGWYFLPLGNVNSPKSTSLNLHCLMIDNVNVFWPFQKFHERRVQDLVDRAFHCQTFLSRCAHVMSGVCPLDDIASLKHTSLRVWVLHTCHELCVHTLENTTCDFLTSLARCAETTLDAWTLAYILIITDQYFLVDAWKHTQFRPIDAPKPRLIRASLKWCFLPLINVALLIRTSTDQCQRFAFLTPLLK